PPPGAVGRHRSQSTPHHGKRPMEVLKNFVSHHTYFAIPMILMSVAAIALVVWRIMLNFNARTDLNVFLPRLQDRLEKEGVDGALKLCKATNGVIPRKLFVAGLETSKQGLSAMRRAMANVIELEILPDLNFLLPVILAIAKIATMVGLLGTVISMIGTFTEIGKAQAAQAAGGEGVASQASS